MCLRCGCGRTAIEVFDTPGINAGDMLQSATSDAAAARAGAPKRKKRTGRKAATR